jgi:hypothetical protein
MPDDCEACRVLSTGFLGGLGLYFLSMRKTYKNPKFTAVVGSTLLVLAPLNYIYRRMQLKSANIK